MNTEIGRKLCLRGLLAATEYYKKHHIVVHVRGVSVWGRAFNYQMRQIRDGYSKRVTPPTAATRGHGAHHKGA